MIQLLWSQCYSHNKSVWGGDREMASAITTGWHFREIKGDQSASKELTLPALTFSKVEIKELLQKIYSNSNTQSATVCLSGVFGASHSCTHTHPHTETWAAHGQQMTSKCQDMLSCRSAPVSVSEHNYQTGLCHTMQKDKLLSLSPFVVSPFLEDIQMFLSQKQNNLPA